MHIILYVLDALRADHLGCYGYYRNTSPNIDAVANEGVVFENCFTSTTWTRPSAASIITGVYPGVHMTQSRYDMLSADLPRLPELLLENGFNTAAFVSMGNIASEFGFSQGFNQYYDLFRDPKILAKRQKLKGSQEVFLESFDNEISLPLAQDINEAFFPWIDKYKLENTFSLLWSIDTHEPYNPPIEFRLYSSPNPIKPDEGETSDIRAAKSEDRQRLINLYDDEIIYSDHHLGEIVNFLKENKLYDETMIIILSDHGEAFFEHEVYSHGHMPYEEVIHVPLIFKFPNNKFAGKRVTGLTELIDILPTIIANVGGGLLDKEWSDFIQGSNLISLMNGQVEKVKSYVFSETKTLSIHNRYLSIRGTRWKYIRMERPPRSAKTMYKTLLHLIKRDLILALVRSPAHFIKNYFRGNDEWLFDLEADPKETHNLIDIVPEKVEFFREVLNDRLNENDDLSKKVVNVNFGVEESEVLQKHLEKLGY